MPPTHVLYVRIAAENSVWLDEIAARTRITKAGVIDLLLTEARTQGWTVSAGRPPSVQAPGRTSPAAGPAIQEEMPYE